MNRKMHLKNHAMGESEGDGERVHTARRTAHKAIVI